MIGKTSEKMDDIKYSFNTVYYPEQFNEKARFRSIEKHNNEFIHLKKKKSYSLKLIKTKIILYTHDAEEHHALIENAKEKGYDVLILDGPLSSHFISKAEQELEVSFVRVDADTLDNIIAKDEEIPSKLTKEEEEKVKPIFEEIAEKEKFVIQVESLNETEKPVIITQSEFMRRMKEQQALGGGGMHMMGNLPEMYNLVINANHSFIGKILKSKKNDQGKLAKQAFDLALLAQGLLKGKDLTEFVNRSYELID